MDATFSFGEWMAQRRKSLDMTQRDLAERAACAVATIKKVEADERRPSRELAELMADALRIPAQRHATFVECARGLRPVNVMISVQVDNSSQGIVSRPRSALPAHSTSFVGRQAELAQIEGYLDDPACRLLTLVGPGGMGKTRLAYEAARNNAERFAFGVYALSMVGIDQPEYLVAAIAERLELTSSDSSDPKRHLLDYLRERNLLLVIDNFEHLLDGAILLPDILVAAPAVKILVTSRERLNLQAEWLLSVDGLAFPKSVTVADALTYPAIELFERSARRVLPGYQLMESLPAIVKICQLVEGMPLAIELAASWLHRMPPAQIAEQIERDLSFLAAGWRDVPERHRSIHALFDYSWQMLTLTEQSALMRLSVFHGGFDAAAAEPVAGASLLTLNALQDKSLVRSSPSGRYDMHELIRQYAGARLIETATVDETRQQHAAYFMDWAELAGMKIRGPEQVDWFRRLDMEHDNLRAAIDWTFSHDEVETGLRICIALWWFWFRRGHINEAFRWFNRGIALSEGWRTPLRVKALARGASVAALSHQPIVMQYARQGMALAEENNLTDVLAEGRISMTHAMSDYDQVVPIFETSLATMREHGDKWTLATNLATAGARARNHGDFVRAERLFAESLAVATEIGALDTIATVLGQQGRLAIHRGDYPTAQKSLSAALTLSREIASRMGVADWLMPLGRVHMYQNAYDEAQRHLEEALDLWRDIGDKIGIADALGFLASLSFLRQNHALAVRQLHEGLSITNNLPVDAYVSRIQGVIDRLITVARIAVQCNHAMDAVRLLSTIETLRTSVNYVLEPLPLAELNAATKEAHDALGETAFAASWTAGKTLNAGEATQFALAYLARNQTS